MKECAASWRGMVATFGALSRSIKLTFTAMLVPTLLTDKPVRPFKLGEMVVAGLIVWEELLKLKKGDTFVSFLHDIEFEIIYKILNNRDIENINPQLIKCLIQLIIIEYMPF